MFISLLDMYTCFHCGRQFAAVNLGFNLNDIQIENNYIKSFWNCENCHKKNYNGIEYTDKIKTSIERAKMFMSIIDKLNGKK